MEDVTLKKQLMAYIPRILSAHFIGIVAFMLINFALSYFMSDEDGAAMPVVTAVSLLLFSLVCYKEVWREAQRDVNRVEYGRAKPDRYRGLKAAAITQGLFLILAAVLCTPLASTGIRTLFRLYYLPFYSILARVEMSTPAICFLPVVYVSALITAAQALGYRGIRLADKIIYRGGGEKKKREKLR